MIYRRQPTPLHAARAAAGCAYCAALVLAALVVDHPLLLGATGLAVVLAGLGARTGGALRWGARIGVPLALLVVVVNALVSRNGLTVIARLGEVPALGRLDVTLEAVAYGAVQGLRALVVVLAFMLYSAAVDPDEVLRLLRRVSFRSALSATLATRMVPVLARDARRMADAQRSLGHRRPPRAAVLRALTAGALDRALDVAAALEVRGYGAQMRPVRRRPPLSRHDLSFAAAGAAVVVLAVLARTGGAAAFTAYPALRATFEPATLVAAGGLVAVGLLPFLDRRGVAA